MGLVPESDDEEDNAQPAMKTVDYQRTRTDKQPVVLTMSLIATHHSLWVSARFTRLSQLGCQEVCLQRRLQPHNWGTALGVSMTGRAHLEWRKAACR